MPVERDEQEERRTASRDLVQVLIVGKKGVLQRALADLISPHPEIDLRLVAQDLLDTSHWLRRHTAHVAILDWPVFEQGAAQLLKELSHSQPALKWLAISLYDDPFAVKQAFDMGIHAYVTKAMAAETICEAIRVLHSGRGFCSPDVADAIPNLFLEELTS
ncbi:response regulator [Planctomycetota bacterium]